MGIFRTRDMHYRAHGRAGMAYNDTDMGAWLAASVRLKIVSIICLSVFAVATLIYAVSNYIILGSFTALEHKEIVQSLQQADDAFQGGVVQMGTKIKDWAYWDDSYQFALDPVKHGDFAKN